MSDWTRLGPHKTAPNTSERFKHVGLTGKSSAKQTWTGGSTRRQKGQPAFLKPPQSDLFLPHQPLTKVSPHNLHIGSTSTGLHPCFPADSVTTKVRKYPFPQGRISFCRMLRRVASVFRLPLQNKLPSTNVLQLLFVFLLWILQSSACSAPSSICSTDECFLFRTGIPKTTSSIALMHTAISRCARHNAAS